MPNELMLADNDLKVHQQFDFRILVPSEKWIPDNSPYIFEVDPDLNPEMDDETSVVLEKIDNRASGLDYGVAAASGLLTGALSILWMKDFSLKNAKEIGDKDAKDVVVKIAKSQGFKPKVGDTEDDVLRKAIVFMEKKFPSLGDKLTADFGSGLNHHLRDFSHHPTIVGLICSILLQFTGKGVGTDTDGRLIIVPIRDADQPAVKFMACVFNGTISWAFHLISDLAGSSTFPGKGTGIPGVIVSLLKEASTLPFFRNIKLNHNDSQISFSQWISKLFNGTLIRDSDGNPLRFDLRAEMGFVKMLADQAIPVLINECIVRGFYFVSRLVKELKDKKVSSIKDLEKLDASHFLPFRNRALTRMLTVSTGVFEIVNVSGAAVKAAMESDGNAAVWAGKFLLKINYVGAVRFAVAVAADAQYIGEDIREIVEKYMASKEAYQSGKCFEPDFKFIRFTDKQVRYLYSLELNMVQYDMTNTDLSKAMLKANWLEDWKQKVLDSLEDPQPDYFIDDEKQLYAQINYDALMEDRPLWLYAFALELITFKPYCALDDSKKYEKLDFNYDYLRDVFCKKQSVIAMSDLNALKKKREGYVGWVRGDLKNLLFDIGVGLVAVFVPFGFSFASLIGAGIGVGIGSVIENLGAVSHLYTLGECSKLITLCDYVILGEKPAYEDFVDVCVIYWEVKRQAEILEEMIKESRKNKEGKAKIKAMNSSKDYLNNCAVQLNNLMRRKGFSENTFFAPALMPGEG